MLQWLCRYYQSFFHHNHPEEARLVQLYTTGQTSEYLDRYFEHEYSKGDDVVRWFSKVAKGWQGGRTLDFGCGAGGLTYQIAKASSQAVGIDLEEYKLNYARQQKERLDIHNVEFVCYDGVQLPFPDASFDTIICVDVIEHLPKPEHFIAEFRRVLRPEGQLLLRFGPPWFHAHGKHMWARLPGWWTHLLFPRSVVMRVAGFPAETTWESLGLHRLSVSDYRRVMRESGLTCEFFEERINRVAKPMKHLPWLRELFISEVEGGYRKSGTSSPALA